MTHKRLTSEREAEIRTIANTYLNWGHVGELLAEIDVLRKERDAFRAQAEKHTHVIYSKQDFHDGILVTIQKEEIMRLRKALENWIEATPTDKNGKFCEINQWHALRAIQALEKTT